MHALMERRFFISLLVLVTLAFAWLMLPLWTAIFWACALSVIFYPLQLWFLQHVSPRPGLMALLTLTTMMLMVLLPLLALGSSLVQDAIAFYARVQSGEIDPAKWIDTVKAAFPSFISALQELGINTDNLKTKLSELAMAGSKVLASEMLAIGQNAASVFLQMALMLYLAFFLLKDGPSLVRIIIQALPLGDDREQHLLDKFAEVTRATVKGNLVVAMVQGALGGIIFYLLAIPAPLLWGVLMTVLSLLPAVGAALVWLPVSLYLYATGNYTSATILMAYGAIVIGLADNILRPLLVGRDTKLPDYLVLFSTIGGISLFGMHGFVLGPLVAALFLAFWQIFMTEIYANPATDAEQPQASEE